MRAAGRAEGRELYGRAFVVIAAEQHAVRLVVPTSLRSHPTNWGARKDRAAKTLTKLAGAHLPVSLTELEKAIAKTYAEHDRAVAALRTQAEATERCNESGASQRTTTPPSGLTADRKEPIAAWRPGSGRRDPFPRRLTNSGRPSPSASVRAAPGTPKPTHPRQSMHGQAPSLLHTTSCDSSAVRSDPPHGGSPDGLRRVGHRPRTRRRPPTRPMEVRDGQAQANPYGRRTRAARRNSASSSLPLSSSCAAPPAGRPTCAPDAPFTPTSRLSGVADGCGR